MANDDRMATRIDGKGKLETWKNNINIGTFMQQIKMITTEFTINITLIHKMF
jgi:ribosomal protein L16/L10AE